MLEQPLTGRVAVLTGGGSGIAAGWVTALAQARADVGLLVYKRSLHRAVLVRHDHENWQDRS